MAGAWLTAISLCFSAATLAQKPVGITAELRAVTVDHNGTEVSIEREQDNSNTVTPDFALTSRPCPPFCVQPGTLALGVETIAELEVIEYLQRRAGGDESVIVVDSRTPDWVARGTIPGAVNIPWNKLNPAMGADPFTISEILEETFGARQQEGLWDFSKAKTAVLFCNGMWCGQSPANIRTLIKFGYPSHKIKWYRGGMQDWAILGLTTVKTQN
jgi:rhodanese-related sulfurtransferase